MEEEDCSSSWCVALRVGWTDMVALLFENGSGTIGLKEVEGRVSSLCVLTARRGRFGLGVLPVPAHGCLRLGCVAKALSVEVEHGEFVLGEDVGIGLELDTAPYFAEHVLQIVLDVRI